jgi:hypothetical protein
MKRAPVAPPLTFKAADIVRLPPLGVLKQLRASCSRCGCGGLGQDSGLGVAAVHISEIRAPAAARAPRVPN